MAAALPKPITSLSRTRRSDVGWKGGSTTILRAENRLCVTFGTMGTHL